MAEGDVEGVVVELQVIGAHEGCFFDGVDFQHFFRVVYAVDVANPVEIVCEKSVAAADVQESGLGCQVDVLTQQVNLGEDIFCYDGVFGGSSLC